MSADRDPESSILESLSRAVASWVRQGKGGPLTRWLGRELDSEGVPTRLVIPEWPQCLEILAEARRQRPDWPEDCGARIMGLALATQRFARPDGTPATHRA